MIQSNLKSCEIVMTKAVNDTLVISGEIPCNEEPLRALFTKIAIGEELDLDQEISLIFCDEEMIRQLNGDYREKDSVTDVLSFPFNDDDFLGEIYICTERMKEQAHEYNFTLEEETCRLLNHGIFHLLGYDHMTDEEREEMESMEQRYFTIDIDSPKE